MTRVALFQSNTGIDPAANAQKLVDAIEQAAAGGAAMLFTPEMSGLLDRDPSRAGQALRAEAETTCSPPCRAAAREYGIWLTSGRLRCWWRTERSPTAAM
jgi:predicted amidohydrolase